MRVLLFVFCFVPALVFGQGATSAWQGYTIGTPPLALRLPGTPSPQEVDLPPHVINHIKKYIWAYLRDESNDYVITMMHVEYSNDVPADAKGAIEGTNGQWETTGSKVAVLSTTNNKISGKNAMQQRGKLIMGGQEHDYTDIVITEGSKLWQVIVMVRANDAALKTVMQKVVDSISF
jgi:hypothetical protein